MTSATTEPTKLPACPEWCTTAQHDPDLPNTWHDGLVFGGIETVLEPGGDGRGLFGDVRVDHYGQGVFRGSELSIESLRRLAADALAGAEWLEAHQ